MMRRIGKWLGLCFVVGCGAASEGSEASGGTADVADVTHVDDIAVAPDTLLADAGCTPVCDGKTCGDDGCGGICGKCGPTQQCVTNQCVDDAIACVPADTATCGWPVKAINLADSAQATSVFSTFGDCTGPGEHYPGAEVVIQFVATDDEVVTLDGFTGASVFVLEDDGAGCSAKLACTAHAAASGSFKAAKGKTYYLVFEGDAATPPFDLDVACCLPQCDGKTCGDDGCGGSCGACPNGQLCSGGGCLDVSAVVAPHVALMCGETAVGLSATDTMIGSDVFDTYPGCGTETYESREVVAYFSSYADAVVTLDTDAHAFVLSAPAYDDPGGTCLTALQGAQTFRARAGGVYWVVLEAGADGAPFDVGVSCCYPYCDGVSCDDGCGGSCNLCEGGYCDGAACVPFKSSCTPKQTVTCGEKVLAQNVMNPATSLAFSGYSCPETDGWELPPSPELVYTFVSATDQRVTIRPENEQFYELSGLVAVLEDTDQGCTGAAACLTQSARPTFDAKAGATYYFVWEPGSAGMPFDFDLDFAVSCCVSACAPGACGIDDGCGGICGCDAATEKCGAAETCEPLGKGESCADPFVLSGATLPTTVEGDLSFSGTQFSSGAYTCSGGSNQADGGRDHVYTFTAPEEATYTFTTVSDWGVVPYVLSSCVGAANADAGCIDSVFQAAVPHYGEPVRVPMSAGQTVYVVVDGGWAYFDGKYTLTASPPCHPVCDGLHCGGGSDGCGGECGCEGEQTCNVKGFCQAVGPGDSCATALPVLAPELPIFINGDTSVGVVDLYTQGCDAKHGDGRPDVVYVFTPPVTGSYEFLELTAAAGWQSFAVLRDCGGATESCVSYASPSSSATPKTVALEAGVPAHIVVDPYYGKGGPFTLKISLAP